MQFKILMIDDSVEIASLGVGFLKSAGYAVKHCVRAEEGWTSNNLSVHVKNIRAKLGAPGKKIESVYATGYRFIDK